MVRFTIMISIAVDLVGIDIKNWKILRLEGRNESYFIRLRNESN